MKEDKMSRKKKIEKETIWPKVTKGSHLTVYLYEDGTTKLEWDDKALLKDIQNAILKFESTTSFNSKPKSTRSKKVKNAG